MSSLTSSCSHSLFLLPTAKRLRKATYWTLKFSLSAIIQIMYCLYQTVPSALPIFCLAIVMQQYNGHPVSLVILVQLNHFLQKWRIIYSTEIGLTLGIALLKLKCQSNPQWDLKKGRIQSTWFFLHQDIGKEVQFTRFWECWALCQNYKAFIYSQKVAWVLKYSPVSSIRKLMLYSGRCHS